MCTPIVNAKSMPRKSATAGETKTDPIKKRKNENWLMVFLCCLKKSIAFIVIILGCKDNAILLNEKRHIVGGVQFSVVICFY